MLPTFACAIVIAHGSFEDQAAGMLFGKVNSDGMMRPSVAMATQAVRRRRL
jgi:hypothetical protein